MSVNNLFLACSWCTAQASFYGYYSRKRASSQHVLEISVLVLFLKSKKCRKFRTIFGNLNSQSGRISNDIHFAYSNNKKIWFKHQGYDLITHFSFQRTAGIKIRLPVCLPDIIM